MTRPWLLVAGDFVRFGGMDAANFALATHLAATGHEVHLVTHQADASLPRMGVRVHRVPRWLNAHSLGMPMLRRAARREAQALASRGARVVSNGGNLPWPGINWVHYVHAAYDASACAVGVPRAVASIQRPAVLRHERAALETARIVVCNSKRTMADVSERLGIPRDRIEIVYYGTDPRRFAPAGSDERTRARQSLGWPVDQPVALFVGALGDRRKGFDLLFESWRRLAAGAWDVRLVVAGGGRELGRWSQCAAAAGLDRSIEFLGYRHDIDVLIAASDVMVHPARYEAYGLSAHEAACRGIPVIVSAAAGVTERLSPALAPLMLRTGTVDELVTVLQEWRGNDRQWRGIAADWAPAIGARGWSDMASDIAQLAERL